MKYITKNIFSVALAALSAAVFFPVQAASVAVPAGVLNVSSIAPYVYPQNAASTPGSMQFMPDGESFLRISDGGAKIVRYETSTGKELETVLDTSHTRESSISKVESFTISPDGSKLLVRSDSEPVYRRSVKGAYHVFEIKRNILRPLSTAFAMQQAPLFSPDSRMVAFVAENNIYIKKTDYNTEVPVTTDGAKNSIINGIPDWTYEEEFSTDCSMAWAPDNTTLCYLRYDESQVPLFTFTRYQGWCHAQSEYALYPGEFSYKYPVAGEKNSSVSVHSYDVDTRKTKEIPLADRNIEYIPRIAFGGASSERLMLVTLNRAQNRMEIYAANPKSTVAKSILVEEAKAWLNPAAYEDIAFEAESFVLQSERNGWNNLYRYSYAGQQLRAITSGQAEVTAYYGTDALGFTYYQTVPAGTDASAAINRVVCRIDRQGKKLETLTPAEGWASASFTPALNYYTVNYSNAATPPVYTLYNGKGKKLRLLEDNAEYASRYASAPKREFFTMQADGNTLNGYMVKPAGFSASKRYPVIMWQYSGPGSQEVVNRWKMDWDIYAATQGFLVVCVDGRGTGARGTAFRDIVYKHLGHYETIDQIAAANYVASLPYADGERIGLSGWSYGGYETLMGVTATDSPWKAAVAIAPVTSWRYYDTVYAERFMLTPQENADGYTESAPTERAARMACRLLIMHGTSDDNVHLSNTMEFVGALQAADRYCDMFLFPAMNHSIYGCDARALVYGRMISYFSDNL
jgi:hypothetical protein